ncbi:nucleotidyltransferase domain-containing protein [Paenibacillus sp. LHD-117]|uniref:nucleotidyltransferase domain-containing protein n=1 Tax=Paenibacillus sp. LHD-117 TaxID=3071412 RepID=UPI0027E17551|nr:nucleotidyltransferase domain-containing protein [Paenibacillus sp. LHD-117]MDQ6420785.1 nucleotidyltransferase domain-containing protein [Paenibacillus sp. LHD-117]
MNAQAIIARIVEHLKQIDGVQALVLGGSRAKGTEHAGSDIDIGIYYSADYGLDITGLRRIASSLDDDLRDDLVTEIGGWGPWINGGGWLKVNQTPVDFIYRDLHKVSNVMDQSLSGKITIDYQPGHPHGFINSIYVAEIALCKVLWDPSGLVGELKSRTAPYPRAMQNSIVQQFLWEANFSMEIGKKGIYKKDLSYIAGCSFRAIACLNQVLFALNETYCMNEKGATAIADAFRMVPSQYADRINRILALVGEEEAGMENALNVLRDLIRETEEIVERQSDKT